MSVYLEAAASIGRELAATAGPAQGRWVGDCLVGKKSGGHQVIRQDVGPDLYGGSAGIGMVLAHLAGPAGAVELAITARTALRSALIEGKQLARNSDQLALYSGASGIALACDAGARALGDDELRADAEVLACQVSGSAGMAGNDDVDLIAGRAGILIALLALGATRPSKPFLRLVGALAEQIIQRSTSGWWGRAQSDPSGISLCGLGHGASGIAWALLAAGKHLGSEDFELAGEEFLKFEEGQFDLSHGSWPDLRPRQSDPTAPPAWMDAWCHGALGIGALRWHLWQNARRPRDLAWATASLWSARRLVVQVAAFDGVSDMTLCHGLAGSAELMLLAFEATGLEEHLRAARRVGDFILQLRNRNGGRWTAGLPGGEDVPGLMLGRAGLAALFLRLHDPSAMESPMLPGSRALGSPA